MLSLFLLYAPAPLLLCETRVLFTAVPMFPAQALTESREGLSRCPLGVWGPWNWDLVVVNSHVQAGPTQACKSLDPL